MRKHILLCLLAFSTIGLASCVKYNGVPQEKEKEPDPIVVKLSVDSLDLIVGDGGKTFTASLESEEVHIEDDTLTLVSADKEIAVTDVEEVKADKKVTVKGLKEGETTITVASKQDPTCKAVLSVKVSDGSGAIPVESVSITSASPVNLVEGGTSQLEWKVLPENATVKDVEFSTSDDKVATVNNSGLVTAVKAGTATIAVTTKSGGKKAPVTVNVTKDETLVVDAYYLMGGNDGSDDPVWHTPQKSREFVLNEGGGSGKEYKVTFECEANACFKTIQYKGENDFVWFSVYDFGGEGHSGATNDCATVDGNGNIKITNAGKYTIYFDIGIKSSDTCVKYWVDRVYN